MNNAMLRLILETAKLQWRLALRDIEMLVPIITMPLNTLVAMAVFMHSGRADLAGYALCASFLLTVGQMSLMSSSAVVSRDRGNQVLELLLATPAPYVVTLAVRTTLLTSMALVGFLEGWLITRFAFGVAVPIHHPIVLTITLVATAFASGGTAMLTAALFSLLRNTRTLQLTLNGPLFLLGGVLVPATLLPFWLQPLSPFVFFYWAADLVRGALAEPPLHDVPFRLAMLVGLGACGAIVGGVVMTRLLTQLRRSGQLGLT